MLDKVRYFRKVAKERWLRLVVFLSESNAQVTVPVGVASSKQSV
jgi:hypothetical protein